MENTKILEIIQVIAARAIIIKNNKILLVSEEPKENGQRSWFLPGGWVEPLEPLLVSCDREVEEEVGIKSSAEKIIFIEESIMDKQKEFNNVMHRVDMFCVSSVESSEIPQDWSDTDKGTVNGAEWFDEKDWKSSSNIIAPEHLRNKNFKEILEMPNCYSFRRDLPVKYLKTLKEEQDNGND